MFRIKADCFPGPEHLSPVSYETMRDAAAAAADLSEKHPDMVFEVGQMKSSPECIKARLIQYLKLEVARIGDDVDGYLAIFDKRAENLREGRWVRDFLKEAGAPSAALEDAYRIAYGSKP